MGSRTIAQDVEAEGWTKPAAQAAQAAGGPETWSVGGPAAPLDVASQPDTAGGGTLQQPNPLRSSARSRRPLLGCCNNKVRYEASSPTSTMHLPLKLTLLL